MVLINSHPPVKKYCQYNFCKGNHQFIEQKAKIIPQTNEYMLLALANATHKRMLEEKVRGFQESDDKNSNYNAKKKQKSASKLQKRALKLANEKI